MQPSDPPPPPPPADSPPPIQAWAARRFWLAAVILLLAAAGLRAAILDEFLRINPVAGSPWSDGFVYWQMAGDMANGKWIGSTPFLSAPLYPYLLGIIRSLHGDLLTVYIVQIVLHLLTAVVVALATRLRFSALAGLTAMAIFLSLTEPALSSMRIMADTLEILMAALLWWRWAAVIEYGGRSVSGVFVAGALAGLLALAWPPALLVIPVYALHVWWISGRRISAIGRAAAGAIAAILVIAPATWHNYHLSGEFIPITAHAGITLRQGNAPMSGGVYTYVEGISASRVRMHDDAAKLYEKSTGRPGTWREIDRFFRDQALRWWAENIPRAAHLFVVKAWWFLTSWRYSDMMPFALEREYRIANRAALAPIVTPWLMGAGLAGILALIRKPVRYVPEWLLWLLPFAVTIVFFYTPRYRVPAIPVLCGLGAYAILSVQRLWYPRWIALLLIILPLPLQWANRAGQFFDNIEFMRGAYEQQLANSYCDVGDLHLTNGDPSAAVDSYKTALTVRAGHGRAYRRLANAYDRLGRTEEGVELLSEAMTGESVDAENFKSQFNLLIKTREYGRAAAVLRRAIELQPADSDSHLALAWLLATCPESAVRNGADALNHARNARELATSDRHVVMDVLAAANAESGDFTEAVSAAVSAAELAKAQNETEFATAVESRLAEYREQHPCRADPRPVQTSGR